MLDNHLSFVLLKNLKLSKFKLICCVKYRQIILLFMKINKSINLLTYVRFNEFNLNNKNHYEFIMKINKNI